MKAEDMIKYLESNKDYQFIVRCEAYFPGHSKHELFYRAFDDEYVCSSFINQASKYYNVTGLNFDITT